MLLVNALLSANQPSAALSPHGQWPWPCVHLCSMAFEATVAVALVLVFVETQRSGGFGRSFHVW